MATKDAEMPNHVALKEEVQRIAKHLATLRQEVDALTSAVKSAGDHQLHRAQDKAGQALLSVEAGAGLLLGVIISR
jgi:uncharacterized protein YlxW (UPF0749 family)